jgi:hypothetical protein
MYEDHGLMCTAMAGKGDSKSLLRPPKGWLGGWGSSPSFSLLQGARLRLKF